MLYRTPAAAVVKSDQRIVPLLDKLFDLWKVPKDAVEGSVYHEPHANLRQQVSESGDAAHKLVVVGASVAEGLEGRVPHERGDPGVQAQDESRRLRLHLGVDVSAFFLRIR